MGIAHAFHSLLLVAFAQTRVPPVELVSKLGVGGWFLRKIQIS